MSHSWADADLIACDGGPWDGRWFHAADWQESVNAARRMAAKHQPPTSISGYTATPRTGPHPQDPHTRGRVAEWTGLPLWKDTP